MFITLALGIYRPGITWSSAPGIGPADFSKNELWLCSGSFHHDEPPATRVTHLRNRTPPYDPPGIPRGFSRGCFLLDARRSLATRETSKMRKMSEMIKMSKVRKMRI